jgi:hypothetical protein
MKNEKELAYARCMLADYIYSMNNDENLTAEQKDVEVMSWLIEQAVRADMYKSALMRIGSLKGVDNPPHLANSTLFEADQRFETKIPLFPARNEVKS